MALLDTINKFLGDLNSKSEASLTEQEQHADFRMKKQMIMVYSTFLLGYFAFLSLISSNASSSSYKTLAFHILLWAFNLVVIKIGESHFIRSFFLISSLLGLYISSKSPENALNVIGLALVQHNAFSMIYDKKILKFSTIITSLVIVYSAQKHFTILIEDNDITKILEMIRGLQYGWAPLYLFNQFCAMYFSIEYAQAVIKAKETEENLNKERDEVNTKRLLLEEKKKELDVAYKGIEIFMKELARARNGLNSIIGNIELLLLEIRDPRWNKILNTCQRRGSRVLRMIKDLIKKAEKKNFELNIHNFVEEEDEVIDEKSESCVKRALLVDDITASLIVLEYYFKKMNIEVEIAIHGEEAVEKFKEKGFGYYSFISMDIFMPIMDGVAAVKEIRKHEALYGVKDISIIMVTGVALENVRWECLDPKGEIRASFYFQKPMELERCKSFAKALFGKEEEENE